MAGNQDDSSASAMDRMARARLVSEANAKAVKVLKRGGLVLAVLVLLSLVVVRRFDTAWSVTWLGAIIVLGLAFKARSDALKAPPAKGAP